MSICVDTLSAGLHFLWVSKEKKVRGPVVLTTSSGEVHAQNTKLTYRRTKKDPENGEVNASSKKVDITMNLINGEKENAPIQSEKEDVIKTQDRTPPQDIEASSSHHVDPNILMIVKSQGEEIRAQGMTIKGLTKAIESLHNEISSLRTIMEKVSSLSEK